MQKIKSQWKAQKRKEGLVTRARQPELDAADGQDEDAASVDRSREKRMETEGGHGATEEEEKSSDEENEDSEETDSSDSESPAAKKTGQLERTVAQGTAGDAPKDKPTLRELQKQAYSKAALHSHKSGSHRQPTSNGRGGPAGRARGRGRSESRGRGRGHGQPDMRLRMNAMLEKIKRDYT